MTLEEARDTIARLTARLDEQRGAHAVEVEQLTERLAAATAEQVRLMRLLNAINQQEHP